MELMGRRMVVCGLKFDGSPGVVTGGGGGGAGGSGEVGAATRWRRG